MKLLKEGESEKKKFYRAIIVSPVLLPESALELLNTTKDLVINQTTPIRVTHRFAVHDVYCGLGSDTSSRRTLCVRERTIFDMSTQRLSCNTLVLNLTTQAGTYVKVTTGCDKTFRVFIAYVTGICSWGLWSNIAICCLLARH